LRGSQDGKGGKLSINLLSSLDILEKIENQIDNTNPMISNAAKMTWVSFSNLERPSSGKNPFISTLFSMDKPFTIFP